MHCTLVEDKWPSSNASIRKRTLLITYCHERPHVNNGDRGSAIFFRIWERNKTKRAWPLSCLVVAHLIVYDLCPTPPLDFMLWILMHAWLRWGIYHQPKCNNGMPQRWDYVNHVRSLIKVIVPGEIMRSVNEVTSETCSWKLISHKLHAIELLQHSKNQTKIL